MLQSGFFWIILFFFLYGAIHSWMASLGFKGFLEKRWPEAYRRYYRLFFNIFAAVSFLPIMAATAVLPDTEIYRTAPPWSIVFRTAQLASLAMFAVALFQTDFLAFGGLRQVFEPGAATANPGSLVKSGFYRLVRHPLYFFGILFMWLSPSLTWNGLGFNIGATLYLLVGMVFEERKLLREFGAEYAQYQKDVPGLIPFLNFRRR